MKFKVIIACYNRQSLTIDALRLLFSAAAKANVSVDVFLYDDGSTDKTVQEVARLYPTVTIIRGPGGAYWARSMAKAEKAVLDLMEEDACEYIMWLNDDVRLDADTFIRLVRTQAAHPDAILVGAMRDPLSGNLTYSGMKKAGIHPLKFEKVEPGQACTSIDTFNGNFVVVPNAAARKIGGIDGHFSHALADIDYGLRARKQGFENLLLPGSFGTCALNPLPPMQPLLVEWKRFVGVKGGGNLPSMKHVLKKEAPVIWPVFIAITYGLWWFRETLRRVVGPSSRLSPRQ